MMAFVASVVPCTNTSMSEKWRPASARDRKSTRLNSSHSQISYAVFCLKKKTLHARSIGHEVQHVFHDSNVNNSLEIPNLSSEIETLRCPICEDTLPYRGSSPPTMPTMR